MAFPIDKHKDTNRRPDRLLFLSEVCDILRISKHTAYRQRAEGKFIEGYRIGRHLRFRYSDVLRWIEQHRDAV